MPSLANDAPTPAPRTRWGGVVTFRGREYASPAELAAALASATQDAAAVYTVTLTAKGEQLAAELAAEAGR